MTITEPHGTLTDDAPELALQRVLTDEGRLAGRGHAVPADVLVSIYRRMRQLRLLDARMTLLQRQGRIGFYAPSTGQEAVPIVTGHVVQADDWVFPALREHSVMLVRGFALRAFLAQIFGNTGDLEKGRQMPCHQASREVHQVSWSSCIGNQLPQAVGAAWGMKLARRPSVAFAFLGDGATSEPDFHAAMTFAVTGKVPAVIVCQNNHWSISVPTERQTASRTLAVKARAYGMPGTRVDGNDALALHEVLSAAAERARQGGGPTFVEALTYRMGAHSTSDDPSRYRTDAEVAAWQKKDPVDRLGRFLREAGHVDAAWEAATDAALTAEISRVIAEVESLPKPGRETLFDDVYAELPWHLRLQRDELVQSPPSPAH